MKNKIGILIVSFGLVVIILLFVFYYYLGIGFGQAAVKTIKGLKHVNEEWVSEGVNPLDSIKTEVIQIIDTTSQNNN